MFQGKIKLILDKILNSFKGLNRIRISSVVLLMSIIFLSALTCTTTARADNRDDILDESHVAAYFVYYDGVNIGAIESPSMVDEVKKSLCDGYFESFKMETSLDCNIEFEEILIEDKYLTDIDSISEIIETNAEPRVKATLLKVNGEKFGSFKDEKSIDVVFQDVYEPYREFAREKDIVLEEISFEEDIVLEEAFIKYEELSDPKEVFECITACEEEREVYAVEEGENVWTIADKHDMTVWELLELNSPMNQWDIIQIGQELNIKIPDPALSVRTVEVVEYTKTIAYETEKRESSSLYINQEKVSQAGVDGKTDIVDRIFKRNGVEEERERISEDIINEPVKEIILVGTKQPVKSSSPSRGSSTSSGSGSGKGTGSLKWPTQGYISSRFGQRWGRFHSGIDIAASTGTPIYAADGGTVSYSAFNNGGYGNLVKVNHGGGMVTFYAHMSSRAVSSGQSVSKGQLLGYVGSTGNSTGPHLHFEVRINGTAQNPLNYLN